MGLGDDSLIEEMPKRVELKARVIGISSWDDGVGDLDILVVSKANSPGECFDEKVGLGVALKGSDSIKIKLFGLDFKFEPEVGKRDKVLRYEMASLSILGGTKRVGVALG